MASLVIATDIDVTFQIGVASNAPALTLSPIHPANQRNVDIARQSNH